MLKHLFLIVFTSMLLTSCNEGASPPASQAMIASGKVSPTSYLPVSGLYYQIRGFGTTLASGLSDASGHFDSGFGASSLAFFLDDQGLLQIASTPVNKNAGSPYLLFDAINIDGFVPPAADQKLVVLLASLDAEPGTPGIQLIQRVRQAISNNAPALLTLLKSTDSELDMRTNPAVLAVLAAFDDPATPASEARTKSDLLDIDTARTRLGLPALPDDIARYPYQTVDGDTCRTTEPIPNCTFNRQSGLRVRVEADRDFNKNGHGADDLWYVRFDRNGNAAVYDDLGNFQYSAKVSDFAGYIGGNTIGVGTTGTYWENVANNDYWLGKQGVLYSSETGRTNYGQAIN